LACERGRAFAEDHERAICVLERDKRSRETRVRVDVGVLRHELAVRLLGLTQPSAREELRGGVAREAVVAADLRRAVAPAMGRERLCELAGPAPVHDASRGEA